MKMKQRVVLGALLVSIVLPVMLLVGGADRQAWAESGWKIRRFDVNLEIGCHGQLLVTEKLAVDFSASRRGIYRVIPIRYRVKYHLYALHFRLLGVSDGDGRQRQTKVSYESNNVKIRIGNPAQRVRGRQVHHIRYQVGRALLWEDEEVVLRWNG